MKIWSTVILAGERFLAIAYPFKIITLSSKRNSVITLASLVLVFGFTTIPRLFELTIKERAPTEILSSSSEEGYYINQCFFYNVTGRRLPDFIQYTGFSCHIVCGCKPDWLERPFYRFWYLIVIETSMKFTVPFLLLLGFNIGIISRLIHSYKFQKKMLSSRQTPGKTLEQRLSDASPSNRGRERRQLYM